MSPATDKTPTKRPPIRVSLKTRDAIKADRRKGQTYAEIAARYRVKSEFVRRVCDGIVPVKREFLADKADEILLMLGLGHSPSQIARHLHVRPASITRALQRLEWQPTPADELRKAA